MKIKATYETEVYICQSGYIAIKQHDGLGDEPQIVLLSPGQAEAITGEFRRLLQSQNEWWTEVENEEAA
ncbi:MAG TPA: hypothetical protein VJ753_04580 [Rhizomicrobium sp.]|nr:hypothetical protein [Rhizomicrobium sp.]